VKKGDGGSEGTALVLVTWSKDDMCALFQSDMSDVETWWLT
jgi:hypothetical protein